MELIDILDSKGNKTGESCSMKEVHDKGLIHKSVHVWILNSKNELLIQKREKNRLAYPLYWDISASGHISAGQTSLEAAQREVKEELGLSIHSSSFIFLFTLEEQIVLNNGAYINNEFQDVYLVKYDLAITDIKLLDGEVEEVKFISIDEFREMINTKNDLIVPHQEEHDKLLDIIEKML